MMDMKLHSDILPGDSKGIGTSYDSLFKCWDVERHVYKKNAYWILQLYIA